MTTATPLTRHAGTACETQDPPSDAARIAQLERAVDDLLKVAQTSHTDPAQVLLRAVGEVFSEVVIVGMRYSGMVHIMASHGPRDTNMLLDRAKQQLLGGR